MIEVNNGYEELCKAFHQTWDTFPGAARLIGKNNLTLAVNKFAREVGLAEGQICSQIGTLGNHKGCLKKATLAEQQAKVDRPAAGKIRGWLPVENYPDIVVHFSLALPEVNAD